MKKAKKSTYIMKIIKVFFGYTFIFVKNEIKCCSILFRSYTRSIWANTKSKVLLKHKKHQCSTTQSCFQSLLRARKNKKRDRERSIYSSSSIRVWSQSILNALVLESIRLMKESGPSFLSDAAGNEVFRNM